MAEMPRQLTQAEIDRILFNQRMGMQPTPPSIQNLQRGTSGTVTPIPQNLFQRMAGGAKAAISSLIKLALLLTLPSCSPVTQVRVK